MPYGEGNTFMSPIVLEWQMRYTIHRIGCVRPLITCVPSGFKTRITYNHTQVGKSRQIGNDFNLPESTNQ